MKMIENPIFKIGDKVAFYGDNLLRMQDSIVRITPTGLLRTTGGTYFYPNGELKSKSLYTYGHIEKWDIKHQTILDRREIIRSLVGERLENYSSNKLREIMSLFNSFDAMDKEEEG
jgi:hypothetical protein